MESRARRDRFRLLCAAFTVLLGLAANVTSAQATARIRWLPPADSDVAGYVVYVGEQSMSFSTTRDIGFVAPDASGVASADITGLVQHLPAYIVMTAYDTGRNQSVFSNEIILAAAEPPPECTADQDCDDLESCNGAEVCIAGACAPGVAPTCPSGGSCQVGRCALGSGCVLDPVADGTVCDDGDPATGGDVCRAGMCLGEAPQSECAADRDCDDGEPCNGAEVCIAGTCAPGVPPDCPAPSVCRIARCEPGVGCVQDPLPEGTSCADGSICNGDEFCSAGVCVEGSVPDCAVPGPCASGICDESLGCVVDRHPDGTPCDDGDPATEDDVCQVGTCAGEVPPEPPADDCASVFGEPHAVRLTLTGPPDHWVPTVLWDAPLAAPLPALHYRPEKGEEWIEVAGQLVDADGCEGHYAVALDALDPLRRYVYRVSGAAETGSIWTDSATFSASGDMASGFRRIHIAFIASNGLDGASLSPHAQEVLDVLAGTSPPPVAILGGGDYAHPRDAVASGVASDAQDAVERWLEQLSDAAASAPFLPVYGDRDAESGVDGYTTLRHPAIESPAGVAGSYSFDFSGMHFLALNAPTWDALDPTTDAGRAQLTFVEEDLAAARRSGADFVFVYLHLDLFSSESDVVVDEDARDTLVALFEQHGVNVVLSGDGASFERSYPMLEGSFHVPKRKWMPRTSGVVYLRAGAGGRTDFGTWLHDVAPVWSAVRNNLVHPFVLIRYHRSGGSVTVATVGVDAAGEPQVLDHFSLF